LKLHTEAGAQKVLAEAVARGTVIHRFEVKEPTLEEIFIEQVRASFGDEEAGGIVDA
jgi:ABC-2 type transport system ATP-binding protein